MLSAQNVSNNITINNNNINNSISSPGSFGSDEQNGAFIYSVAGADAETRANEDAGKWKIANGTGTHGAHGSSDAHDDDDADANVKALPNGKATPEGEEKDRSSTPHAMNPLHLHLLTHPSRGRGVFAPCDVGAGIVLEESPVLLLSKEQWEEGRMNDTILGEYGFCWSNGGMAIGLGLASLFNHSASPNVNFIRSPSTSTIRFITSRHVEAGEELCICYSADESKLWFTQSESSTSTSSSSAAPAAVDGLPNGSASLPNGDHAPEDPFPFLPSGGYSGDNSDEELTSRFNMDGLELFAPEDAAEQLERIKLREVRKAQIKAQERSSKEARRARWFAKHHHKDDSTSSLGDTLAQPVPLHLDARPFLENAEAGSSGSQTPRSGSGSGSGSEGYTYAYPEVPEGLVHEGDLPPPLHSQASLRGEMEAELVPDLDWREDEWPPERTVEGWGTGAAVRVKGLTEEREEERDQASTLEIWVAEIVDPRMTRLILNFIKDMCTQDSHLRHLKRVARKVGPDGIERAYIALCATYEVPSLPALQAMLADYNSLLSDLVPQIQSVPSTAARSLPQIKTKNLLWPVVYAPLPAKLDDCSTWTSARKSWVRAGIHRILDDAMLAKQRGELPVATFVTSPPASFWPVTDAFVPPTPDLRAGAHDTRISEKHPLRHAAFNCIAQIASLRTRPPFCTISPTRNGADYLLTSLSLFITHEPCVMCAMALLHSRVREVFYIFPRAQGGGFESAFGVHGRKDLNHRYDVWKYTGPLSPGVEEKLKVDEHIAL